MNSRTLRYSAILSLAALTALAGVSPANQKPEQDRSPVDLALLPNTPFLVTANEGSGTVSLVNVETGKVIQELKSGSKPFDVAISPDRSLVAVSNRWSDSVSLYRFEGGKLQPAGSLSIGVEPRGLAFNKSGQRLFVACAGEDQVEVVDLAARKTIKRIDVNWEPWHMALSPDGSKLSVGCTRGQTLDVININTLEVDRSIKLKGRNVRHIAMDSQGAYAYVPVISERGAPVTRQNIDLGWVVGNRLTRCSLNETGPKEAIALDTRGRAVGDLDGLALSADGQTVVLSAAGTHELIVLRGSLPFEGYGGPGDHINDSLRTDRKAFQRIPVGGRPLGLALTANGKDAVVANALLNSVQVVNLESGAVTKSISLGGPAAPSVLRKGEAIFYDAERSFNQWYSCGTCHTEGGTNGGTFDTLNDGSYNTPKKTLSLRGAKSTAPWTWHGLKDDLRSLVRDSMLKSMQGPEPSPEDLEALTAYIESLPFRPSRIEGNTLAANEKRGQALFFAKKCNTCHAPPSYSSAARYDVETVVDGISPKTLNPPSLRGVRFHAPYLHRGDVWTLEKVLTQFHRPSQLTQTPDFTEAELADMVAFLRAL